MNYLDVTPTIATLRSNPDHFEFTKGALHHIPSTHRFKFDTSGHMTIEAQCACSHLEVSKDQEEALVQAFNSWQMTYWRPLEINRQFAAHFTLPLWRRTLIDLVGRLHRALLTQRGERHSAETAKLAAE